MHKLQVRESKVVGRVELHPGTMLVEDINGAEMLAREVGTLDHCDLSMGDDEVAMASPINHGCDYNGKDIVIVRPGGYGDLLFLGPSLRQIKRRWPTCRLHVACFDEFAPIFDGNPDVDVAGFYPLKLDIWNRAHARIWLENVLEKGYAARHTPAIDLLAERIGIAPLMEKKLRYFVSADEKATAEARFPRTDVKRIGYHLEASAACRTYPGKQAGELGALLRAKGYELVIFGRPVDIEDNKVRPGIIDLTTQVPPLSFRESAAVLATCDGLIGPDSSMIHLADALGVPAVGLYGPFEWHLRTSYAEKTFSLQGKCSFGPCAHHARNGQTWPVGGPCNASGHCDALASIDPKRIVAKLESLI